MPPVREYPHRLAPFALRTAFPSPLEGRYSPDYYGACVTVGLAPLTVIPRSSLSYVIARLRLPTYLLECPRWASFLSLEVHPPSGHAGAGPVPVSCVFPAGVTLPLLEIRVEAV